MSNEENMKQELIIDLTSELEVIDVNFNATLLEVKIANAIREVKSVRKYPEEYEDWQIDKDIVNYYSNIRDLALYDYAQIGMPFEKSHSGNDISHTFTDREKCFNGVLAICRL